MKKHTSIVVAVFLMSLSLVLAGCNRAQTSTTPLTTAATAGTPLVTGSNAIFIADQKPTKLIIVSYALLSQKGYVAIHADSNGNPGEILGYTNVLPAGETKKSKAPLIRVVQNQENLFAMLHSDNGNNLFDPKDDPPIKDPQGNIIMMRFTISDTPLGPVTVTP